MTEAALRARTPRLDPEACWQAYQRRAPEFDGRFFAGITTTGIFCRTVCPSRRPRREHLRFFPDAAAAAGAGFRPCRRCRPESAPGSGAWRGSAAVVARARKLIEAGALDAGGIDMLADRVGVGARQLRRLFAVHLGVSPRELARQQRAARARRLLERDDRPIAQVALEAGFHSVRQFNDEVRRAFGATPSALRARHRARPRRQP